jgi:hypothetical protein
VRLPRDWLGPREDLVPFGPRADSPPAGLAGTSESEASGSAEPSGPPPSAQDFWSEQSASLQHALQGPEPGDTHGDGTADVLGAATDLSAFPEEPRRETSLYVPFRVVARVARRRLALSARLTSSGLGRKAAALLAVPTLGAAVVLLVASSAQTPRIVAASAPAGSHSVAAMLAMAAARVRVPTVGQLPARRRIVRPSARAHRPRPVHHASTAPAVQVAAVSHRSTSASTAPSSAASYGGQGSGGSSYVSPPATSNAQAATSTPPPSAASQSQPAGPTGPGAILGPGHCNC